MKIYNFHNGKLRNNFNPQYSFYLAEDSLDLNTDTMAQLLLNKEKEFLNKYPSFTDGGTGLGNKSITSRFYYYNLLQIPETKFLKKHIRKTHDKFLMNLGYKIETNYYAQCWFNVMREGEQIEKHFHAEKNDGYLSGHICIDVDNTNTYFELPYFDEKYISKNQPNKITLFPSWVKHYTDQVPKNKTRITLAFDIRQEYAYITNIKDDNKFHWEKI